MFGTITIKYYCLCDVKGTTCKKLALLSGRPEKLPDVCYSWWVLSSLSIIGRLHWIDKVQQQSSTVTSVATVCVITYFTLVGVVSSDVRCSSCTTSFTPCCPIIYHSYVFFQKCPCPLLDVINVLHPSSFPWHHSENACLTRLHPLLLHACQKKAISF